MSTILKALRRLEDDRESQAPRPLREEVTVDPRPEEAARRRWPRALVLGIAGSVLALGAGVMAFQAARQPEPVEVAKLAQPVAVAPEPIAPRRAPPRAAPVAAAPLPEPIEYAEPERELPPAALASRVEVVRRPEPVPRIEADPTEGPNTDTAAALPRRTLAELPGRHKKKSVAAYGGPPTAGAEISSETASEPGVEPMPQGHPDAQAEPDFRRSAAPPPREEPAPPAVQVPRSAPPEPTPPAPRARTPEPAKAPEPTPTPQVARSAPEPAEWAAPAWNAEPEPEPEPKPKPKPKAKPAPSIDIRVESTEWHPIAERRVAHVEVPGGGSREIREGDSVGSLVVGTIEPSSVVFKRGDVEVRQRVGD